MGPRGAGAHPRHARRARGPRHGARLPGQPHPQLRAGRPRARARRRWRSTSSCSPASTTSWPGRSGWRRARRRRGGRAGDRAAVLPLAPADPHRRHHRPGPAARVRVADAAPPLGRGPAHQPHRHPARLAAWRSRPSSSTATTCVAWVLAPLAMAAHRRRSSASPTSASPRGPPPTGPTGRRCSASPSAACTPVVWVIATVLSFLALFLQAGIIGLPLGSPVGLTVLLSALAALMLGRLTNLPAIVASAIALGLLEVHVALERRAGRRAAPPRPRQRLRDGPGAGGRHHRGLLVRRRGIDPGRDDDTSSWQVADEIRPMPRRAGGLDRGPPARCAWPGAGRRRCWWRCRTCRGSGPGNTLKAAAVLLFAIVSLSITVLTGWAGQVSLGQMGFVAIGGALGAKARPTGASTSRSRSRWSGSPARWWRSSSACPRCACAASTWR